MPKKKTYPYRIAAPKSLNPMKEMSWCLKHHIKVGIEPEGRKVGQYWEMTGKYQVVVSQGDRNKGSGFIYTKDDVMEGYYEAYRKTYELNYGKEREV